MDSDVIKTFNKTVSKIIQINLLKKNPKFPVDFHARMQGRRCQQAKSGRDHQGGHECNPLLVSFIFQANFKVFSFHFQQTCCVHH